MPVITKCKNLFKKDISILLTLYAISTLIRLKINYSTEFIGGNNGAYYLLLNRTLIENGTLVYKEFPLLFYLQSYIALIPIKLNLLNVSQSIDFVSRIFDSIIPPLSIFPAYLLVNKIIKQNELAKISVASLSILHFTFFILISDFQKNSLGLLWLFWLLYFLLELNKNINKKDIFGVIIFFVLTGLTHFGCFGVAIFIIVLNIVINFINNKSPLKLVKIFLIASLTIILSFAIVYLISPWRYESLIEIIKTIFNKPIIVKIINNEPVLSPMDLFQAFIVNILAVISLLLIIKKKNVEHKNYLLLMIIVSFVLSSPLLNFEIAQRLYFVSFITMIPLIAFVYENFDSLVQKRVVIVSVLALIFFSVLFNVTKPVYSSMNKKIYDKALELRSHIPMEKRTIIVARHGLEYWLKWILRNDTIREEDLTSIYWRWYKNIYFVHQKKDKPPFGPAGIFGKQFSEPTIPENSKLVYSNDYFDLYKSNTLPIDFSIFKKE